MAALAVAWAPWATGTADASAPAASPSAVRLAAANGTTLTATLATSSGGTGSSPTTQPGTSKPGAGPSGADARSRLEQALARRLQTLGNLTKAVDGSTALSDWVRATLESQLQAETSGIEQLAASVPSEPATDLRGTATSMVDDYRVYLVMAPKVRIAVQSARQRAAESRATTAEPTIAARVSAAQASGRTVSAALSAEQSLSSGTAAASGATGGVDLTAVLELAPSGYPGNSGVLADTRSALASARSDLQSVRADVRTIRRTLRGART